MSLEKYPNYNYELTNWLPFYWNKYQQTTHYTYIIDDLNNLDDVYNNFTSKARGKIRKASKCVIVTYDRTLKEFYQINKMTFERQNIDIPYNYDFIVKHDEVLKENNSRKIFFAIDEQGQIHSALYLTWDQKKSYVHMVRENPKLRNSGAGYLLILEAIKLTKETLELCSLDFEGSMIESVEKVRRAFGAKQYQYFRIFKSFDLGASGLIKIILKDIYYNFPKLRKIYKKYRGF